MNHFGIKTYEGFHSTNKDVLICNLNLPKIDPKVIFGP
jgi:hypothetical protein